MAGWSEHKPSAASDEDVIDGFGITIGETRNVARRQLIGSIVALMLVAAFAIIAGLRSLDGDSSTNAGRSAWAVQSPIRVAPVERIIAAKQDCPFERSASR